MVTQLGVHFPAEQLRPIPQSLPHAPQLVASDWRFLHTPLHSTSGKLHVGNAHWWSLHT
jgi:hypothetical protein